MSNLSSTLTRTTGYNPFVLDDIKINNIIFYNDEGQLLDLNQGWFGNNNNYCQSLDLGSISYRRKINFSKKENFCVSVAEKYTNYKNYDLYIYVDNKNVKIIDKGLREIQFDASKVTVYHDYDFEVYGYKFSQYFYVKSYNTDFGNKVDAMAKELEELHINIDTFHLRLLMEKYELVRKGN